MSDDVFRELRTAILRGEYAPRQRLIETELIERYAPRGSHYATY
jgi:DNA-binding GntR family transcriptional regulator